MLLYDMRTPSKAWRPRDPYLSLMQQRGTNPKGRRMKSSSWRANEGPEERAAREEAYKRLAEAANRAGLSLERLRGLLERVATNETETRQLLSEVYGVSDGLLDDLMRVRLQDLRTEEK